MVFTFQDIFIVGSETAATIINWAVAEMKGSRVLKKAQSYSDTDIRKERKGR